MKHNKVPKPVIVFSYITILLIVSCFQSTNNHTISLKGQWQFQTDPEDIGIKQNWYLTKLNDVVNLPGSMRDNDKGYIPEVFMIVPGISVRIWQSTVNKII